MKQAGTKPPGGTAAAGTASTSGKPPSPEFQALDSNGDGQISVKEADTNPMLKQSYKKLDSNGDGQLSKTEFAAFAKQKMGEMSGAGKQSAGTSPASKAEQSSGAAENPNRPKDL